MLYKHNYLIQFLGLPLNPLFVIASYVFKLYNIIEDIKIETILREPSRVSASRSTIN
jgi:hypothetical protein